MSTWDIAMYGGLTAVTLAAAIIWLACQQIRRLRQIIDRSGRDRLTGLPARGALYARLEALRLGRTPYAVGLLNLDGFAAFNEQFHHRAGDQLLVLLAGRANAHLASTGGHLYRLGGDELAAVWTGCDEATAYARSSELLRTLEEPADILIHHHVMTIVCTGALGVAWVGPHTRPGAGFVLGCADSALQHAKRHGPGIMLPWRPSMAAARRRRGRHVYGLITWSPNAEPTLLVGRNDDDAHRQAVRVLTERLGTTAEQWARQIGGSPDSYLKQMLPAPDHEDWDSNPGHWLEQLAETLTWPSIQIMSDVEVSR